MLFTKILTLNRNLIILYENHLQVTKIKIGIKKRLFKKFIFCQTELLSADRQPFQIFIDLDYQLVEILK